MTSSALTLLRKKRIADQVPCVKSTRAYPVSNVLDRPDPIDR